MISSRFKSNKEHWVLLSFCKFGLFEICVGFRGLDLHREKDKIDCFCLDFFNWVLYILVIW